MSEYFGAGDEEKLRYEVGTTLTAGLLFTVALSGLCAALAPQILRLTRVSRSFCPRRRPICASSASRSRSRFCTTCSPRRCAPWATQKSPLLFLATSCVLNIFMDYVTIVHFHMGVEGAALATAISEALSALLCALYVWWKVPLLRMGARHLCIHKAAFAPHAGLQLGHRTAADLAVHRQAPGAVVRERAGRGHHRHLQRREPHRRLRLYPRSRTSPMR